MKLLAALALAAAVLPAYSAQWPPVDPNEEHTSVHFTQVWAHQLRSVKTIEDVQRIAGSKGKITGRGDDWVTYHWISAAGLGVMVATLGKEGTIAFGITAEDVRDITLTTNGAYMCDECTPPEFTCGKGQRTICLLPNDVTTCICQPE